MAANPIMHAKIKHVDFDLHFVRERVLSCMLQVAYVPAKNQVADLFSKPLAVQQFLLFRHKLNVVSFSSLKKKNKKRGEY
ncbi:hypothetical protein HRI_000316600 [Hibiscus trionum]|uniref:Uncharacterized protein n=1 Tax=Hibiscus trionum TaxID=183268 RepID=A0A9W7GXM3_HIBTR|nr:hypothetical protein HRI_000316600 [Hibiscus trionum]